MSSGIGGGGNAPTAPTNPMPALTAEVREALVASIREHGVICPVVKDQTGFVLDGYNRLAIAAELGVSCREVEHPCTPDQREILRIELNGARRQITASQWKPLVDHLRSLRTSSGHRFSERAIAQAVGVARSTVKDYKPVSADGRNRPSASKVVTTDGKVRNQDPEWTATDRVLHLIRQSTTGLIAEDLYVDSVLSGFGRSTISKIPGQLRDRGQVVVAGKRGRSTVWAAAPPDLSTPPPAEPVLSRKVNKLLDEMADPKIRDEIRAQVGERKGARQAEAMLRVAERELEAARLDEEKRVAEGERDRLRQIEILRSQPDKSVKAWDKLTAEVRAAAVLIAAYVRVTDELPAINSAFERILDRELAELKLQIEYLLRRLHPNGNGDGAALRNTVIDV